MKSFAILAATFAGAAFAQDMPMPEGECANLCINNMATIAQTDFQCEQSNIGCFCTQSNWAYGIRDCTRQACDADQSAAAVQWAYARCAGVAATGSETPAALPILTSAVASATGVDPSATGTGVASAASSMMSSGASGFESITSSAAADISSAISSASDALASASSSIASELASITDSAGNVISSATGAAGSAASSATDAAGSAASSATDAAGSAASGASDAAGSATSSVAQDAAPKATAMPLIAGAGIAAWLLL